MNSRRGGPFRTALAALATIGALVVSAGPALADESATPTTQAVAYHAEWVPYLEPPGNPAAVCLVDSGVNLTPDTPADSAGGPIVRRLAVDGGPGTAANTTWEGLHGTRMASSGAAPQNGWGAVGVWPGAHIVSIRAMPSDRTTFPFDNYQRAIDLCERNSDAFNIVAVNLSLACQCPPGDDERSVLDDRISRAHTNGISVVAAAGNNADALGSPASEAGVFAIAAGDRAGGLCSFSNRGVGIDLIGPGCELDLADPSSGQLWSDYEGGTSAASMTASTVLALLRSYRPDLGWQNAEQLLAGSGRSSPAGPLLDVEALFRTAGLGALVEAAKARAPAPDAARAPSGSSGTTQTTPDVVGGIRLDSGTSGPGRFPAPRLDSVLRIGRRLTVSVRNRPRGARLVVLVQRRVGEFGFATLVKSQRTTDTLPIRLPRRGKPARLVLRYELPKRPARTSPSLYRGIG
jgi:hypothetical protein